MPPLDQTRVPTKNHGNLCFSVPLQGKHFSSLQHVRLTSSVDRYSVARWHPPEGSQHISWPSSSRLCPCRLETLLPHKEIHAMGKRDPIKTVLPSGLRPFVPTQIHHGCPEEPVAGILTQPAHVLRSTFWPKLTGRFCHSNVWLRKPLCTCRPETFHQHKKHPVTGPRKHLLPSQALPAKTETPNKLKRSK